MSNDAILTINCGSSSIKLALFHGTKQSQYMSGEPGSLNSLLNDYFSDSLPHLKAICHRYVHGGDHFYQPLKITPEVVSELKTLNTLAPLHNPLCLQGVIEAIQWAPQVDQIAIFDTAFHHDMPWEAAHYALPETYKVRRYGFHGIAHQALWHSYSKQVSAKGRVITLQLGNGCSVCAIQDGRSIDTSMGFTPAEGLVMGTRAGDIDWALIPYIVEQNGVKIDQVMLDLNFQSGLKGVSGISSNMKDLLESKDSRSEKAIDLFCYRIVKYIGSYIAVLGGLDALIFSGGIGQHAAEIRKRIVNRLSGYRFLLDRSVNERPVELSPGSLLRISASESSVPIYVASVDESGAMAREAYNFLNR